MKNASAPAFLAVQRAFAAHIRDPQGHPAPAGVSPQRMGIYTGLFFRNLDRHLADGFPVIRRILPDSRWHALVRAFLIHHRCRTPLFPEIGSEFVAFLGTGSAPTGLPGFLPELADYEYLEVRVANCDRPPPAGYIDAGGNLLAGVPVVSPSVRMAQYRFPVHRIGPDFQPASPPATASFLLVYRNSGDRVQFMEVNSLTCTLVRNLQAAPARTGRVVLAGMADDIGHADPSQVIAAGARILSRLLERGVLLGTAGNRPGIS